MFAIYSKSAACGAHCGYGVVLAEKFRSGTSIRATNVPSVNSCVT
jgi:hypothetical protein